jgi:hypothetical protein
MRNAAPVAAEFQSADGPAANQALLRDRLGRLLCLSHARGASPLPAHLGGRAHGGTPLD